MLNHSKILWYTRPGEAWTDALPLGNGRLGAMVYGGIEQEKIALNDDTLWSKTAVEIKDSKEAIQHARELILQRKFTEAEEFLTENNIMRYTLNKHYDFCGVYYFKYKYPDGKFITVGIDKEYCEVKFLDQ